MTAAPKLPAGTVQSFESQARRRTSERDAKRLTDLERADLEYLWHGYAAELGVRSVHGSIEGRLLRSPPDGDAFRSLLRELKRVGGRADEGAMIALLVAERSETVTELAEYIDPWSGKRHKTRTSQTRRCPSFYRNEVRAAIAWLVHEVRLERVATEAPKGEHAASQWTGFDLRLTGDKPAPTTAEERKKRWQREVEEHERMWRLIDVHETASGKEWSPSDVADSKRARRILASIALCPPGVGATLYAAYGVDPVPHEDVFGELGGLVEATDAVRELCVEAAEERARPRLSATLTCEELRAIAMREVRPSEIVRENLKDSGFVARVRREAEERLVGAVAAWREARRAR